MLPLPGERAGCFRPRLSERAGGAGRTAGGIRPGRPGAGGGRPPAAGAGGGLRTLPAGGSGGPGENADPNPGDHPCVRPGRAHELRERDGADRVPAGKAAGPAQGLGRGRRQRDRRGPF
ncbi:hypothetical protein D7X94_00730 [Acutalibacter sp. 1XD8-33]|nr:hypothetical protein D7X94_00730 [Acutalibacter sp. 1XD8-33]